MNTKTLALLIIFTALTIAINIAGPKIPAPYAPFLLYQLWEIPIVITFLAIGIKEGIMVTVINALVLLVYDPGPLLLGPIYNLIAVLSMMLGVYIPYKIATRGYKSENINNILKQKIKLLIILTTALGIVLRVVITSLTNYFALQQGPPVGFGLNQTATIAALPLIALFNATVAIYTIPIGISIAIAITSRFKL